MNAVTSEPLSAYRLAFDAARPQFGASEAQRTAAFEHFSALGFPSARDEAWKYTNLRRLASRRFAPAGSERQPAAAADAPAASAGSTAAARGPLADYRRVLVDGRLRGGQAPLPAGYRLRSLEEAAGDGEPASALLRVPTGGGTERFAALNAALCADVVLLDIAAGSAPAPIEIVLAATGTGAMSHPRLVIRAARGSLARVILRHVDAADEHFVNSLVDVEVGTDATLHLYRLLAEGDRSFHIERIEATVGRRGSFVMHDAQLGAGLARLDLHARLTAAGAAAELTGLFLADGIRHLDTHLLVDHVGVGTRSLQDYRGIAAGRGRAVWNGKAIVHPGAQKSEARQTSRNLLLSPDAEIDTKPELEIYADDVQCQHGATTGQLDAAALFYLRSRGLDEREARSALTRAFTGSVISRMDHEPFAEVVRGALDLRLASLLEGPA